MTCIHSRKAAKEDNKSDYLADYFNDILEMNVVLSLTDKVTIILASKIVVYKSLME